MNFILNTFDGYIHSYDGCTVKFDAQWVAFYDVETGELDAVHAASTVESFHNADTVVMK